MAGRFVLLLRLAASRLVLFDLRSWRFALNLRPWSFPLHRISDACSLGSRRAWSLNLRLCALLLLDLANLLSLIVSLLPFQLTHFAARFFIPARCFTRERIYLLLTARIHLRYSGVPLIPDLELLVLGFLSNALDTQRLVQILLETRSHRIIRDYDCPCR